MITLPACRRVTIRDQRRCGAAGQQTGMALQRLVRRQVRGRRRALRFRCVSAAVQAEDLQQAIGASGRDPPVAVVPGHAVQRGAVRHGDLLAQVYVHGGIAAAHDALPRTNPFAVLQASHPGVAFQFWSRQARHRARMMIAAGRIGRCAISVFGAGRETPRAGGAAAPASSCSCSRNYRICAGPDPVRPGSAPHHFSQSGP